MWQRFKKWFERHVVAKYRGPAPCFDCNKTTCRGCTLAQ